MIQQPQHIDSPREELVELYVALQVRNRELEAEVARLKTAITNAAMAFNTLFEITNMAPRK